MPKPKQKKHVKSKPNWARSEKTEDYIAYIEDDKTKVLALPEHNYLEMKSLCESCGLIVLGVFVSTNHVLARQYADSVLRKD